MIEIQNSRGQYLALYEGTTIENEINSWLLSSDGSLEASFSIPFRFPLLGNESFLQHKHRVEAYLADGISVSVAIDGLPIASGKLVFSVEDTSCDGVIFFAGSESATKLKNNTLRDATESLNWSLGWSNSEFAAEMYKTTNRLTSPYPFVFFPVKNEIFTNPEFELEGHTHMNYVNPWLQIQNTLGDGSFITDTLTTTGAQAVPFFYLTYIIKEVCKYLNYSTTGTWLDMPGVVELVMYNEVSINQSGLWGSYRVEAKWHVWDMTIAEFFKLLRDEMGVGVFFDSVNNVAHFYAFTEIAESTEVMDVSKALLKGEKIQATKSGYTIEYAKDDTDEYKKSSVPQKFQIGTGEQKLQLRLQTLQMSFSGRTFGGQWLTPVVKREGKTLHTKYQASDMFLNEFPEKSIPPTLLAYYGMQPSATGKMYPYGSSISINAKQETCGSLSVAPEEIDSIFNVYTRPFYEFLAFGKKATFRFFLNYSEIAKIKMWKKLALSSASMPQLAYLISRITYQIPTIEGKVLAEIEMLPFLPPSGVGSALPNRSPWVAAKFAEFDTTGLYPPTIITLQIDFELYTDSSATFLASVNREIVVYYFYKTKKYNAESGEFETKEIYKSSTIPANEKRARIDEIYLAFWRSDDDFVVRSTPDEAIVRGSFTLLPGAGYRIIKQ